MCGILGVWNPKAVADPLDLQGLSHRGPDGRGEWCSPDRRCWLGHTRLAIQDLSSAGQQPMTSACGRLTLAFNGEIYNHRALRKNLRFLNWHGHSDTETLVQGLVEQGLAFLKQLRGMYAFAAYDNQEGTLWLARDAYGIKPLYVAWAGDELRFSSEQGVLQAGPSPPPQQRTQLLCWGHLSTAPYWSCSPDPAPTAVPPGSVLEIRHPEQRPTPLIQQRWPTAEQPPSAIQGSAIHTLRTTLEAVVEDQLLADVPVACFLSSGLDSGILTALACRMRPRQIATFTVALPGMAVDESASARVMARHCGSNHHELVLAPDQVLTWVRDALQALDSPTADGLNTYLISRAVAAEGIKVALSGLGADELFGGYPSHRVVPWLLRLRWMPRPQRLGLLKRLVPRLHRKLEDVPHWDAWHLTLAVRRWATAADLEAAGAEPLSWPIPHPCSPRHRWGQISWGEMFGYTEPMLLRDSDVFSMASGLELRVPFLDQRLVAVALSVPARVQRPGKTLLREACRDLFPPGYLNRPKQGFTLPMRDWMLAPLRELCLDRLDALCGSGWLSPGWVASQWLQFESGKLNWPRAWSLVVMGEFARRHSTET